MNAICIQKVISIFKGSFPAFLVWKHFSGFASTSVASCCTTFSVKRKQTGCLKDPFSLCVVSAVRSVNAPVYPFVVQHVSLTILKPVSTSRKFLHWQQRSNKGERDESPFSAVLFIWVCILSWSLINYANEFNQLYRARQKTFIFFLIACVKPASHRETNGMPWKIG